MKFKYGDLVIKCHQCGEVQVIEELVEDGRCLYLFNKDDSYIKLHCPKCDITMEMVILPNEEANAAVVDGEVGESEELIKDEGIPEEIVEEETVQ